jgi:hypothetical protein
MTFYIIGKRRRREEVEVPEPISWLVSMEKQEPQKEIFKR